MPKSVVPRSWCLLSVVPGATAAAGQRGEAAPGQAGQLPGSVVTNVHLLGRLGLMASSPSVTLKSRNTFFRPKKNILFLDVHALFVLGAWFFLVHVELWFSFILILSDFSFADFMTKCSYTSLICNPGVRWRWRGTRIQILSSSYFSGNKITHFFL